jgi:hypothetical protein
MTISCGCDWFVFASRYIYIGSYFLEHNIRSVWYADVGDGKIFAAELLAAIDNVSLSTFVMSGKELTNLQQQTKNMVWVDKAMKDGDTNQ